MRIEEPIPFFFCGQTFFFKGVQTFIYIYFLAVKIVFFFRSKKIRGWQKKFRGDPIYKYIFFGSQKKISVEKNIFEGVQKKRRPKILDFPEAPQPWKRGSAILNLVFLV